MAWNTSIRIFISAALAAPLVASSAHAKSSSEANAGSTRTEMCIAVNQTAISQLTSGRITESEDTLFSALGSGAFRPDDACTGVILNNIAAALNRSGRPVEAEAYALRSTHILEAIFGPSSPAILRPLHILALAHLQQGKAARAKEVFERMRSIHLERPNDRAVVHGMAALILHSERKLEDAESECLRTIEAWEEAGDRVEVGAAFGELGSLYTDEHRFEDARSALDRALGLLLLAKDATPGDRAQVLNARAVMHARQNQWREAEQDLREAVSMVETQPQLGPMIKSRLLVNYAFALRRNHHRPEASAVEARAAAFRDYFPGEAVVDFTELLAKSRRRQPRPRGNVQDHPACGRVR